MNILTTGQVAKICAVAPRTAAKWIDTGELKGYTIPGSRDRRVTLDTFKQFILNHQMPIEMLLEAERIVTRPKSLRKPKVVRPSMPKLEVPPV